jgi:arabinogalactan endo-1,4-beta-galactosidase
MTTTYGHIIDRVEQELRDPEDWGIDQLSIDGYNFKIDIVDAYVQYVLDRIPLQFAKTDRTEIGFEEYQGYLLKHDFSGMSHMLNTRRADYGISHVVIDKELFGWEDMHTVKDIHSLANSRYYFGSKCFAISRNDKSVYTFREGNIELLHLSVPAKPEVFSRDYIVIEFSYNEDAEGTISLEDVDGVSVTSSYNSGIAGIEYDMNNLVSDINSSGTSLRAEIISTENDVYNVLVASTLSDMGQSEDILFNIVGSGYFASIEARMDGEKTSDNHIETYISGSLIDISGLQTEIPFTGSVTEFVIQAISTHIMAIQSREPTKAQIHSSVGSMFDNTILQMRESDAE